MKTAILLLVLLVAFIIPFRSNAAWEKVRNLPPQVQGTYLLDVFFLKSNTQYGWASGYNGHVLRTTDGGSTWLFVQAPVSLQAECIFFLDEKNGYLSGDDMVFKSTDGGVTWKKLNLGSQPRVWGCSFYDVQNGVAVGGGCSGTLHFFRTTNGGANWSLTTHSMAYSGLSDAVVYPDGMGYAVSSGMVWRTEDFGAHWDKYSDMNHRNWQEDIAHLNLSFLIPASNGCEGTDIGNGAIYFSTDLGLSWNTYVTPNKLYGAFLTSEQSGWAVGKNRSIYHTKNSGKDWELDNCGIEIGDNLDDCFFFTDSTGFVVGDGIYYRIKDTKRFFPIAPAKDTTLCGGESLVIRIQGKYDYFEWSNGESGDSIVVTESGKYFVRGLSECDSSHSDTIEVIIAPAPDLNIVASKRILCPEGDIVAYATEHFDEITWSTGERTDTIHIDKPGIYYAYTTNQYGCSSYDTIEIKQTQFAKPKIEIDGRTKFCTGSSALLSVPTNFLSYAWAEASAPQTILSAADTLRVWQSGSYYVNVIDSNLCVWRSDSVQISVLDATNSFEIVNLSDTEFGEVGIMGEKCVSIIIRNNSSDDQMIEDLFAARNTAFSIPRGRFPMRISAHQVDSFVVCFAPRAIGEYIDSVQIPDLCSEWTFPLHGLGVANINYGESGCGPDYQFKDENSQNKKLSIVAIYPSPARESVRVVLAGEQSTLADVSVYNSTGMKLLGNSDFTRQSSTAEASLSQLPPGIYCLVAVGANAVATAVFVKE